jgi:hypothetical protein
MAAHRGEKAMKLLRWVWLCCACAVLLGFFLKPTRFAYGEKFFTDKEAK